MDLLPPDNDQPDIAALQHGLVEKLKSDGNLETEAVEAAFRSVPRHRFVPDAELTEVYDDVVITTKHDEDDRPISSSSQPAIMAIMLEQLDLKPGHRVLEIGAGTGYNAALMAHIVGAAGQVVTVDIDRDIVENARRHLADAGFDRVRVICADGAGGYSPGAPYDRIILSVAADDIAPAWLQQLAPGGRIVLPFVLIGMQISTALERRGDHLESISSRPCGFMPLRGSMAVAERESVKFTPERNLEFYVDKRAGVDGEAIHNLLRCPYHDHPTAITVTQRQFYGIFMLWLSLHEPGVCYLVAHREHSLKGVIPYLFGMAGHYCWSMGLAGTDGLALLMQPPGTSIPQPDEIDWSAEFPLYVRSYDASIGLAQRLIDQVHAWDAAGRPSIQQIGLEIYPHNVDFYPPPGEFVLTRPWSKVVVRW